MVACDNVAVQPRVPARERERTPTIRWQEYPQIAVELSDRRVSERSRKMELRVSLRPYQQEHGPSSLLRELLRLAGGTA